jgi:dCMP deaminase
MLSTEILKTNHFQERYSYFKHTKKAPHFCGALISKLSPTYKEVLLVSCTFIFTDTMTNTKQERYDKAYLKMALEWAKLSHCKRKQVGAIIVKNRMIISDGYNGTPSGFENCCEDKNNETHWYVLHAEANAILKTASSTHDCSGATVYLTLSPCKDCSKLVHQAGITRLVYINKYSDTSGIEFLKEAGVEVVEFDKKKL